MVNSYVILDYYTIRLRVCQHPETSEILIGPLRPIAVPYLTDPYERLKTDKHTLCNEEQQTGPKTRIGVLYYKSKPRERPHDQQVYQEGSR